MRANILRDETAEYLERERPDVIAGGGNLGRLEVFAGEQTPLIQGLIGDALTVGNGLMLHGNPGKLEDDARLASEALPRIAVAQTWMVQAFRIDDWETRRPRGVVFPKDLFLACLGMVATASEHLKKHRDLATNVEGESEEVVRKVVAGIDRRVYSIAKELDFATHGISRLIGVDTNAAQLHFMFPDKHPKPAVPSLGERREWSQGLAPGSDGLGGARQPANFAEA